MRRVMVRFLALLWVAGAPSFVLAANVYKCRNADGGMTVSNTPCAKGAEPDAKLSSGSSATTIYKTSCERVAVTGTGLVQIGPRLNAQQARAVADEAFGRRSAAGASRVLAELTTNGTLRVCAYLPGGDALETLIDRDGTVRRDGVVDSTSAAARTDDRGIQACLASIDVCRSGRSFIGVEHEECVRRIVTCTEPGGDCCPQACLDAYWRPPFEHQAGVKAMKTSAACRGVQRP